MKYGAAKGKEISHLRSDLSHYFVGVPFIVVFNQTLEMRTHIGRQMPIALLV